MMVFVMGFKKKDQREKLHSVEILGLLVLEMKSSVG
jgi:hypothetical protein